MTRKFLTEQIKQKHSYLCIGLDTDIDLIPLHLRTTQDPVFEFNKQIIDATSALCVSYKINTAFYEAAGSKGWESMQKTVEYIPSSHFKIADAKRGDIGNTSAQYAKAFFERMDFDAITIAPYMGEDSVRPFLEYEDKWTILLGLTSNKGAHDFELQKVQDEYLFEKVIKAASAWGTPDNLMFVIGATQSDQLKRARRSAPEHFFLVPGIGTQGGSLADVSKSTIIADIGLLVNISRAIIYASANEDFAEIARLVATKYQMQMAGFIDQI